MLLILAGVCISYIVNGGIINKTQVAMDMYENADKKQQDIINEIDDYMKEEISNNNSGEDTSGNENNTGGSGSVSDSTGIQVGEVVTAEDIANVEDKSDIYGAEVKGYDCENNAGVESWKLFYADSENVYLIASNYIHKDYCPDGRKGSSIYDNGNGYKLSMNNVIDDYNGLSDITDERIKKLNSDLFNKYESKTNTLVDRKVLSYMLDISEEVWGKFAGDKAEYAIGGPTLEILFKSYNEKYNTNNKYQAIAKNGYETNGVEVYGYQISSDGGNRFEMGGARENLNCEDDLYVINDTEYALAMWVASPSCDGSGTNVFFVDNYGGICSIYYDSAIVGFRPLVCLKSTIQLEKQKDGSFLLK